MPRPILAEIDLASMRHNVGVARRQAGARHVWAVVKANAYGHGIERVLPALQAADGLALLDLDEARRARAAGWRKPILLLEGFFDSRDLGDVASLELTPALHDAAQLDLLATTPLARAVSVYVKVNTGMQRLGFVGDAVTAALKRLRDLPHVTVDSLMTHFANGEGGGTEFAADVDEQLRRFLPCAAASGWSGKTCLANSAALLLQAQVKGDAVRPGILLYGGTPASGRAAADFDLKPVMRMRSKLIAIQHLAPGDAVGYGSRWVARKATRVGVVACGYADGYPRAAPDGTPVWVDGAVVPLAGRVSMDMLTVDLADAPQAQVGSPVELWGEHVPVDVVAERAGTVGYELMCALTPRVPTVTINGD